jgi:transposase
MTNTWLAAYGCKISPSDSFLCVPPNVAKKPRLANDRDSAIAKRIYSELNCTERLFGHFNRAIAARYDQLADNFRGMLFLASARCWINLVQVI